MLFQNQNCKLLWDLDLVDVLLIINTYVNFYVLKDISFYAKA